MEDELFAIESDGARTCLALATELKEKIQKCYMKENVVSFAGWLGKYCKTLIQKSTTEKSLDQSTLWPSFHKFQNSVEFQQKWMCFLESLSIRPSQLFFQTITTRIFDELLKELFPLPVSTAVEDCINEVTALTYEERNAIRYVGGSIVKKLIRQYGKDDVMVVALNDLVDEEDDLPDEAEEWMASVDRGGLVQRQCV